MNENTDKTENKQRQMANLKPFPKGVSGNPKGRPKGTLSIVGEMKKRLAETPVGWEKTFLELLVNKILKIAIVDGDVQMIKQIWNYIDGMPKQGKEVEHSGRLTLEEFLSGEDDE